MPGHKSRRLKEALKATQSCFDSHVASGFDSHETEGWRDTCDHLFQQLTPSEQAEVQALERALRKKYAQRGTSRSGAQSKPPTP